MRFPFQWADTPFLIFWKRRMEAFSWNCLACTVLVGLRGMQLFRSDTKSLPFKDREQIAEVTKLGPIVHCSPLSKKEHLV